VVFRTALSGVVASNVGVDVDKTLRVVTVTIGDFAVSMVAF